MNHAKEPWEVVNLASGVAIRPSGTVSIFDRIVDDEGLLPENAQRIVDCVNAMQGIENPAAFMNEVKKKSGGVSP